MTLTPARLTVLLVLIGVSVFAYFQLRSPWVEVDGRDFERRVLQAPRPALVYFDTAVGCRDADSVFEALKRQRAGALDVFYVNSIDEPELARAYGVKDDVVFVLFERGRVVNKATAPDVLAAAVARNNGIYSDAGFLAQMDAFVDARLY